MNAPTVAEPERRDDGEKELEHEQEQSEPRAGQRTAASLRTGAKPAVLAGPVTMPMRSPICRSRTHHQGFTLIEVLMAVSVIAILMAIIIPAIGGAQNSAKRAKTRVQFSQWSAAIEQFRQEYGYYPVFAADWRVNGGPPGALPDGVHIFHDTLSARRRNGEPLPAGNGSTATDPERQNPKRISFCSFGASDFANGGLIQDAFGNTDIGVLVDRNLSGMIDFGSAADYPLSLDVSVASVTTNNEVNVTIDSTTRIRAGVAFFSAGDGQTPVTSW